MSQPLFKELPNDDGPKPLTVAELDRKLRRVVESATFGVWVQGEVGGLHAAASGHAYFTLKDEREDAVIDAVAYRDTAQRARRLLSNGARILVRGKATVWAPRGRLQLVVDAVRLAGRGALLEALERRKAKLAAEGLFASERKQPVPSSAKFIGVVTSASGAVIHDIVKVAFRRDSVRILLSPTVVQGEDAPHRIVNSLNLLEKVAGLDVIIVGRGGGSFEDLMAFNDEAVVRRVVACRIPIVSAIGHEVDITLTDLAADARAATPSQAAEMVVADASAQAQALAHGLTRLQRAIRLRLRDWRADWETHTSRLGDPRVLVSDRHQGLDELEARQENALRAALRHRSTTLERVQRRLVAHHPKAVLARTRGSVQELQIRLKSAVQARLAREQGGVQDRTSRLDALSPIAVLSRGYAIALGPDGRAVREASEIEVGDAVKLRLRRGQLTTRVEQRDIGSVPPRSKR